MIPNSIWISHIYDIPDLYQSESRARLSRLSKPKKSKGNAEYNTIRPNHHPPPKRYPQFNARHCNPKKNAPVKSKSYTAKEME